MDYYEFIATGARFGNFLYDLATDPTEMINLLDLDDASQYTDSITYFRKRQKYWASLIKDPEIPVDNGNKYSLFRGNGGYCAYNDADFEPLVIDTSTYKFTDAPNIVFVLVDDWGYNDVGFRSTYMNWTTPTIDQLVREGISLENHYSYELCTPTRGALLTGRYSLRTGQWNENLGELPLNETTLAQEMQSAGYRTYMVGKWDLGYSTKRHYPVSRGFDSFYGFYNGMIDYHNKTFLNYVDLQTDHSLVTNEDELSSEMHTAYLFQSKVEDYIADHATNYADQPMFMYYATQLIHGPWDAPDVYVKRCADPRLKLDAESADDLRNYCALNVMLDEVIANLTCSLNAHGMADNTILVIVSDNGGDSNLKYSGNSYPFKGHKGSVFRGGVSTTAIVHSKLIEEDKRGVKFMGNVHITDWLPTLMGRATNGKWKKGLTGAEIDGEDVWSSMLSGDSTKGHEELVFFVNNNASVLQVDQLKYFYNQYDVGTEEASFYFLGDLNPKKSTKACTSSSLVTGLGVDTKMTAYAAQDDDGEVDFTDSFLSFPVPLDVPKTLSGKAMMIMSMVSVLVVVVLSMRIYVHNSYGREERQNSLLQIKGLNMAQEQRREQEQALLCTGGDRGGYTEI